jgi:hypothetical protein
LYEANECGSCQYAYSYETNCKDVVSIREETNTSDNDGAHMVPAERSLVDLSESETAALVRVGDMSIVVVEVVKGSVASRCPGRHRSGTPFPQKRRVEAKKYRQAEGDTW